MRTTDLTFFTNKPGATLLDRFNAILKDARFFDILVGYFRSSGFFQIYKSFENIEKIRILVGMNLDKISYEIIDTAPELNFESHSKLKEQFSELLIKEIENSEDKKEVEEGINKFIEFLKTGKIEIKLHPSRQIHAKLYICRYHDSDREYGSIITGSSNFSKPGLTDNYEFNVQLKNSYDVEYALNRFEELWKESVDVTDFYVDTINTKTYLNDSITPYQLYLKFLYEYFQADLSFNEQLIYSYFPKNFKHLEYQKQAVINAKKIIQEYGGVFLADVVGLGKTYMAAMLINQLPGRNLVIAPPSLLNEDNPNSWKNVFYNFKILSKYESIGKLDKILKNGTEKYDNVIIDEAHKFRNENNITYDKIAEICRGKRVILVSATPLNNSPKDILAQIKLFQKARNSTIPGIKDLEKFFTKLQNRLKDLDRQKDYNEFMDTIKENAVLIRDKVLKYIMIRRTRKEIEKYFRDDLKKQGVKFPEVKAPQPIFYKLDKKLNKVFENTIKLITDKKHFKYARYTPLLYLKEELTDFEKTGQRNMGGFMKILLVKRLESSFFAFKQTLDRFIQSYENFIKVYDNGYVYISKKYWQKIIDHFLEGDFDTVQKLIDEEKAEKYSKSEFIPELTKDVRNDLKTLKNIKKLWSDINYDPKLASFVAQIKSDTKLQKNKIIIFTESKETAEYLSQELEERLGEKILLYHGTSNRSILETVIENFDANSKHQSNEYRIIVTTEVLSEGVNLHRSNVVINYDIPWNPTRMIQRVGRINRLDTPFDTIFTYNFFPTDEANDIIKLTEAAMAKISYFIEMLGNDAKLLTDGEEIKSHELFKKLTSKEYIEGEQEDEDSELKYYKQIENIRNNDPKLFQEIKTLPKKIRVARTAGKKNAQFSSHLITYLRKGNLDKFYLADKNESREIDFITAARIFETKPAAKPKKIPDDFYQYLKLNKDKMDRDLSEDPIDKETKGKGGQNFYIKILKIINSREFRRYEAFTEEEEEYISVLKTALQEGTLTKRMVNEISKKIKNLTEPRRILATIKDIVPEAFLKQEKQIEEIAADKKKEVILSEFLI